MQLRGVHADLEHRPAGNAAATSGARWPAGRRSPSPCCGSTVHRRQRGGDLVGPFGVLRAAPVSATTGAVSGRGQHRVQRVEQGGRREPGGRRAPVTRRSRVFASPGTGAFATTSRQVSASLGESTPAMSRTARRVPRTEPDTFDRVPAARGR